MNKSNKVNELKWIITNYFPKFKEFLNKFTNYNNLIDIKPDTAP